MHPTGSTGSIRVEFQDQMVHICSELRLAGYIHLAFDYPAPLNIERLQHALGLLITVEPVLGCRFVVIKGEPFWVKRTDLDQVATVTVIETEDPVAATEAIVSRRFCPWTSPNINVSLLRSQERSGDRLILSISHVIADGTAALDLAAELSDIYCRVAEVPDYRPEINHADRNSFLWLNAFKLRDRLGLLLADLAMLLSARHQKKGMTSTPEAFLKDHPDVPAVCETSRLDASHLSELDRYAQQQESTLNDLLLTAFLSAFDQFFPSGTARGLEAVMPINMRRFAPIQRRPSIRNLAGTLRVFITPSPRDTFEQTLAKVKAETQRQRQRLLGTEGQILTLPLACLKYKTLRRLVRKQILKALAQPSPPCLTYFGQTSAERYRYKNHAPVALMVYSEPIPSPVILAVAVRMDDQLSVSITSGYGIGAPRIRGFMNQFVTYLIELRDPLKAESTPVRR